MEIDWLVRLMGVHLVMGRCWAADHTLSNQCAAACLSTNGMAPMTSTWAQKSFLISALDNCRHTVGRQHED